ncbi:hypothetical protein LBMAG27_06060 [Bacteroidota bacterium]|nr:hypothetical protein LBMAG27_06060 [Bacteroidota bacterium]
MKKLIYLAVMLCFIQVGISKAQSSVNSDKQKKETVAPKKNLNVNTSDVNSSSVSPTTTKKPVVNSTSSTCTPTKENPSCCQKKTSSSCCSGTKTPEKTSSVKNNDKKVVVQNDVTGKQNLGTTPK